MSVSLSEVLVREAKAAAAFCLDMRPDEIDGYIVIGILENGDYEITANILSRAHTAALLADVVARTVKDLADEMPHEGRT